MGSFAEPNNNNVIKTTTPKNTIFTTPKWPSSRRKHSLSSSSSSLSSSNSSSSFKSFSNDDSSPPPTPPQRIPFSWESIPGIPKHQIIKRLDSSSSSSSFSKKSAFLPLPPAATPVSTNTTTKQRNYKVKDNRIVCRKDPFFAALVECSKGDDDDYENDVDDQNKVVFGNIWRNQAKSLSHRFGFVNFSCKNTCSVSESLVFLPTVQQQQQPKRISYGLVKKTL